MKPVGKGAKAKLHRVKVALPFGIGEAEWGPDSTEQRAAWSLYVELITRTAVQPLAPDAGVAREALASLHSLFPITRAVLREAGPDVGAAIPTVGGIAVTVLNKGLRPFLTKWHARLLDWESKRPQTKSVPAHEAEWPQLSEFRKEFGELRVSLEKYALGLGRIAGVAE